MRAGKRPDQVFEIQALRYAGFIGDIDRVVEIDIIAPCQLPKNDGRKDTNQG